MGWLILIFLSLSIFDIRNYLRKDFAGFFLLFLLTCSEHSIARGFIAYLSPSLPSFIHVLRRNLYWFQTGTVNECSGSCFFPPIPFVFLFSFSHSFIAGIVPIMLSFSFPLPPSVSPLPVVKQQGPCDSKLRKLPIKGNMYLTKESQEEKLVCIIAKERVIWRHLSWTGQFPVSGAGQKYPSQKKKKSRKREKDTPPFFSCNLLHFATMHNFAMAG